MNNHYEDLCDSIDAGVFTGTLVCDDKNRKKFKYYLEKWLKEVNAWEKDVVPELNDLPDDYEV